MTTDTQTPTPPATGREAAEADGGALSPEQRREVVRLARYVEDRAIVRIQAAEARCDAALERLTRDLAEANARAEAAEFDRDVAVERTGEAERDRDCAESRVAAVTRAAEWLAERRRRNWVCSFCPAYHACGPNASPQDCVARLAEAPAGEEATP